MIKVTVIIPCINEENAIGKVLRGFPRELLKRNGIEVEIIVVDNNSTDNTAIVAKELGAKVIFEAKKGKGNAMITGMRAIGPDTNYVVMLDGDNTYRGAEITRMIEPLINNFCDVVTGSRLGGKISKGSMRFCNRVGNWFFSFLVRVGYSANITDVLTGYFAWKYEVVEKLRACLTSTDFSIEMEMITKMAKMNYEIYSVPITYDERVGNSNLIIYKDGFKIFKEYLKNLRWKPLLKYKRNVRIAFVTDAIYPYNKGGKGKRLFDVTTRLAQKGHDVNIYCMKWWKEPKTTIIEHGVKLHAISPYIPLYSNNRRSIKQALIFGVSCLKLINEKFDVIDVDHMPHFPVISVAFVSLLKRKPFFSTWNEVWGRKYWISYMGIKGNIGYLVERISASLPKKIISISNLTTTKLEREFAIKNIYTIPIGVDTDQIDKIQPSIERSDVLYCGRLLSHKNIDYLINALSLLKDKGILLNSIIVGEGPEKEKLIKLSSDLGLSSNIKFYDFIQDQDELYSLIKSSRLFVSPSTREGFGIAVLEANACGVPVLITDHPDNAAKEMVVNGINGFHTQLDPVVMADTILRVLSSEESIDAKRFVQNYSWDKIITSIEKTYKII